MGGGRSRFGVTYGSKKYKELKAKMQAAGTGKRNEKFVDFGAYSEAMKKSTQFFNDPNSSNSTEWLQNLKSDEKTAIEDYTDEGGIDYNVINKALYTKNWSDIPNHVKDRIQSMDRAFDKAVLLKGIQVTRQCDFKIFGAKYGEKMSVQEIKDFLKKNSENNVVENKGYLSFGANNHGAAIAGSGLVIHLKVPPSIGAGAYVNPISTHAGSSENEFLLNRGANMKIDVNSFYTDSYGKVHVNATWVPGKKKKGKKK